MTKRGVISLTSSLSSSNLLPLIYFLLFFTSLCLSFLVEFKKNCSNISLVTGKYVISVSVVSLISCGR